MEEEQESGGIGPTRTEWCEAAYTKVLLRDAEKNAKVAQQALMAEASNSNDPKVARAFHNLNKWLALVALFKTGNAQ